LDDKVFVSIFWRHAEEIFATARQNPGEDCRMAILVDAGGAIHITSPEGWNLESLRLHHGATAAYQVTRRDGRVRVDARSSEGTCVLEGMRRHRSLLNLPEMPCYQTIERTLELSAG
jgi:hypothetical protein